MTSTKDHKPRAFNPDGVPPPPATYSHVAVTPLLPSSRLITLAGLTGCDPASSNNPKTVREQASLAYSKIEICLAAAGASPRDIVQVKHYIVKQTGDPTVDRTDVVDRGWGKLWIDFMDRAADGHRPPDTVIGVASLATSETLYECEVWAIVH